MMKNITWKAGSVLMIKFKDSTYIFIGLMLWFSALIDYMLLVFAYRDFSWGLVGMFIYAPIGIVFGYSLLQQQLKKLLVDKKI